MSALRGLLRKETFHILRDRRTLAVLVLMPLIQVVLFGYAISTDVRDVRVAIVDPSPSAASLDIRARFAATDVFETVAITRRIEDVEPLFRVGRAQAAIVFAPDFNDALARGLPARVQILTDATEPNTGSAREAYVLATLAGDPDAGGAPAPFAIVPTTTMRFNPTRESSNLFVPGLMAVILTIISSLMTALSLTREKETGTMEALLVSPLRPVEIIVGKVLPYLAIGIASVLLVIGEARLVFHVPLRGSALLLVAEGTLFILVSLALGILISSRTSSQRVAMMGALAGTMLPTQLLSGFIFPIASMPRALQFVSRVVPATWFVRIARGIMLEGIGIGYLWRETLVLALMAVALLALSVRSFRTRLA